MPFLTEEIWHNSPAPMPVCYSTAPWPHLPGDMVDAKASADIEGVIEAISAIRALRSEMNVPAAARLPLLIRDSQTALSLVPKSHEVNVLRLAGLDRIENVAEAAAYRSSSAGRP